MTVTPDEERLLRCGYCGEPWGDCGCDPAYDEPDRTVDIPTTRDYL